jgi:NitT/TauT family transport system permease protein
MTGSSRLRQSQSKKHLYKLLGILLIVLVWWFLALRFASTGIILSPIDTAVQISSKIQQVDFWTSIFRTLYDAFSSFLVGFICAFSCAVTALRFKNLRYILAPFVTLLRSAPTIAVIVLFILILPLEYLTLSVSFLVIFPLLFKNLLASLESTPSSEIEAAEILGLPFISLVIHIYIPNALLLIAANINSTFGLNYKIVIASEILGRVGILSIGSNVLTAKQSLDFAGVFTWLVISILLAFILDYIGSKIYKIAFRTH